MIMLNDEKTSVAISMFASKSGCLFALESLQ